MYHPKKPSNRQIKAYTLIEVLVALFIFVILTAIIAGSLLQLLTNSKIIRAEQARLMDVQTMLATLQFDLSQVADRPEFTTLGQAKGSFYTKANSLHFYKMGNVNPGFQFNRTSMEEVEYRLEAGKIIRLSKSSDDGTFHKQILLTDVHKLNWKFLDAQTREYGIWPPTQDWAFKVPVIITGIVELPDYGVIEIMAESSNHETSN